MLIKRERDRIAVLEPDGRERWRLTQKGRFHIARVVDGLLVVNGDADRIEAFDLQTGESLWRLRGWNAHFMGDFIVLRTGDRIQVYAKDGPRLLWSAVSEDWYHLDQQRQSLLVLGPGGVLAEYDLATGEQLRSAMVGIALGSTHDFIRVSWDSIAFVSVSSDALVETLLDRETLRPIPGGRAKWREWREWRDCGTVICALEHPSGQPSIVDKKTGAVLWSSEPWHRVVPVSTGLLILGPLDNLSEQWRVLDLVDTRRNSLASLWGWVALVNESYGRDGEPIQVDPILLKPSAGRTEVSLLTPTGVRSLGNLPSKLNNCAYEEHLLVCKAANNLTEVWRIDF